MPENKAPSTSAARPRSKRVESTLTSPAPATAADRAIAITDPAPAAGIAAADGRADAVARRAFEIFADEGWQHGHDVEHWLRAEREIRGDT